MSASRFEWSGRQIASPEFCYGRATSIVYACGAPATRGERALRIRTRFRLDACDLSSNRATILTDDPYHRPSFSLGNRLARATWELVRAMLFRPSPRPMHPWRSFVLRCFGAKLGSRCHIYPGARIWAPWNLHCEDSVTIADEAVVYNPAPVYLGSHAIVSQQAYLCGATHDYESPGFELQARPIHVERYAWICARATVHSGLRLREGSILALGAVATRDLSAWCVYAGVPARQVKTRRNWIDGSGAHRPNPTFASGSAVPGDAIASRD